MVYTLNPTLNLFIPPTSWRCGLLWGERRLLRNKAATQGFLSEGKTSASSWNLQQLGPTGSVRASLVTFDIVPSI